ncbi:hypothetical protein, partial [Bacillus subtilis]|uniref:hypothetical protein n=1 Tax=Bacillus subtilis TaxID=1423 RepID=UPI001BDB9827
MWVLVGEGGDENVVGFCGVRVMGGGGKEWVRGKWGKVLEGGCNGFIEGLLMRKVFDQKVGGE